jgi:hypothetical protein
MADNVVVTAGSGTTVGADEVADGTLGTVKVQYVKLMDGTIDGTTKGVIGANGLKTDPTAAIATGAGAVGATVQRVTHASDDPLVTAVTGSGVTVTTTVTRPADTNAYAANDALSNSTSAPTSGGFTLSSLARASGGSGLITDIMIVSSNDPATLLQGELWLFDAATTNINDNAAFALSDGDALLLVGVVPFTLASSQAGSGTNSVYHATNLNIGFTCVGTADLRFLVKVKNAYTPANAETLTVRVKATRTT